MVSNPIYTNNHTGSVLLKMKTMDKLFKALKNTILFLLIVKQVRKICCKNMQIKHNIPYIQEIYLLTMKKSFLPLKAQSKNCWD